MTKVLSPIACDVPDGLYVTRGDGTIFVRNGLGEIDSNTASGSVARFETGNRAAFSTGYPGGFAANTSGAGSHPFRFEGFFAGSGTTVPSRAGFRCASGC